MRRVLCLGVVLFFVATATGTALAASPTRLPLHGTVTFSGQTLGPKPTAHTTGRVFASARWNDSAVYVLSRRLTDAKGRWAVRFHPSKLGRYTVRIRTPDGASFKYVFIVY